MSISTNYVKQKSTPFHNDQPKRLTLSGFLKTALLGALLFPYKAVLGQSAGECYKVVVDEPLSSCQSSHTKYLNWNACNDIGRIAQVFANPNLAKAAKDCPSGKASQWFAIPIASPNTEPSEFNPVCMD